MANRGGNDSGTRAERRIGVGADVHSTGTDRASRTLSARQIRFRRSTGRQRRHRSSGGVWSASNREPGRPGPVDVPTPSLDAAREREAAAARKRDERIREANEWLREKERRDGEKAQGDADLGEREVLQVQGRNGMVWSSSG